MTVNQQKYLKKLCTRDKQVSEVGKHATSTFKNDAHFTYLLQNSWKKDTLRFPKGTITSINFT